jgi:hypothetical protein
MAGPKDIPVSDTDEIAVDGGARNDKTRTLSDYRETNSPLSANEIEQRRNLGDKNRGSGVEWQPRTSDDTEEPTPIPED